MQDNHPLKTEKLSHNNFSLSQGNIVQHKHFDSKLNDGEKVSAKY